MIRTSTLLAALAASSALELASCANPPTPTPSTPTAPAVHNASGLGGPVTDALRRGDFAAALALARPLAEKGDATGENILGLLYLNGWGVPKDEAMAAA